MLLCHQLNTYKYLLVKNTSSDKVSLILSYSRILSLSSFKITGAEYVKDYVLRLTFSNGEVRTVDWNNEIGFAPEYLYERGKTVAGES